MDRLITYVLDADGLGVSTKVSEALAPAVPGDGPIHVCRPIAPDSPGSALARPSPLSFDTLEGARRVVEENVILSPAGIDGLRDAAPVPLTPITVRVPWPLTTEAERALVAAKLWEGRVRLAVPLDVTDIASLFRYFNRLELPWVVTPPPDGLRQSAAAALTDLAELWLFDPSSRASLEPIASGCRLVASGWLASQHPAWRYRVLDAAGARLRAEAPWTPSAHAALITWAGDTDLERLEELEAIDSIWMEALRVWLEPVHIELMLEPQTTDVIGNASGGRA